MSNIGTSVRNKLVDHVHCWGWSLQVRSTPPLWPLQASILPKEHFARQTLLFPLEGHWGLCAEEPTAQNELWTMPEVSHFHIYKIDKYWKKSTLVLVSYKPETIHTEVQHIPMPIWWIILYSPLPLKNKFCCWHVLKTDFTYRCQTMSKFNQSTFLSSVLSPTILIYLYCCSVSFVLQPITSTVARQFNKSGSIYTK